MEYEGKRCALRVGHHGHSNLVLSVILVDEEHGFTLKPLTKNVGELYTTHTSNSLKSGILPLCYSYVNPDMKEFIESNNLGKEVQCDRSPEGFPLYSFNKAMLKKYDPKGYKAYMKGYMEAKEKLQSK